MVSGFDVLNTSKQIGRKRRLAMLRFDEIKPFIQLLMARMPNFLNLKRLPIERY